MPTIGGKITMRHEREVGALLESLRDDPEALASTAFVAGCVTAGRVMEAGQILDVLKEQGLLKELKK